MTKDKRPLRPCKNPDCSHRFRGHPNKKFHSKRCKDRYHNKHNPRGYFAHLNTKNMTDEEYFNATEHPCCGEALGQD